MLGDTVSNDDNTPPIDPIDADILAELDAEFAELEAEVARINAMPQGWAQDQVDALLKLKEAWAEKLDELPEDRPEWRKRVDTLLASAAEGLIKEAHAVDVHGRMSFAPDSETMTKHGAPLVMAAMQGLAENLSKSLSASLSKVVQKSPAASDASGEEATADGESPAQPKVEVKIDLGSIFQAFLKPKDEAGKNDKNEKSPAEGQEGGKGEKET